MKFQTEAALIEAILFLETEPILPAKLSRISKLSRDVVFAVLEQLKMAYQQDERGIELLSIGDTYQLIPKQLLWEQLRERYGKKGNTKLSKAAMETLSIIAYSQPITKTEIENIRGVSSDSMVKLLISRKFIQEIGRKDAIGRPIQYGTTNEFLRYFHLTSIAELPKLDEIDYSRFEKHAED